RTFVRVERFAHGGMNAVCPDKDVAARRCKVRAVAVKEIGGDAAIILGKRAQSMTGMNARLAEPRAHGVVDDTLQAPAMDRELRVFVAGIGAARLAPDLLAEAIGIDELVGPNPRGIEPLEQSQIGELLDGVG